MFPRWLWFNHVPSGMRLSPEEVIAVRDRVRAMGPQQRRFTATSRRMLASLLPWLGVIVMLFGFWLYWLIQYRPRGSLMMLLNVAGILAFNMSIWVLITWSINRAVQPLVWKALNQIGRSTCEGCGYILEYHPHDLSRCPECGADVSRSDPERTDSTGQR